MAEIIIGIVLLAVLAYCIKIVGTDKDKLFYLNPNDPNKKGLPAASKNRLILYLPVALLAFMVLLLPIAFGPINAVQGAVILVVTLLFSFGLQYLVIKRNK